MTRRDETSVEKTLRAVASLGLTVAFVGVLMFLLLQGLP